jgi:hypothetical protein
MFKVLQAALILIRKDTIVLYPAIIGGFAATWLVKLLTPTPKPDAIAAYFVFSWLLNLFLQLLIADCGDTLLKQKTIRFGQLFLRALIRFFPSLLWTGLGLLITGGLFIITNKLLIAKIIVLPLMLLLLLCVQIFPIVLVTSEAAAWAVPKLIYTRIRQQSPLLLQILIYLLLTTLLFLIITLTSQNIPPQFKDILISVIQGVINVIIAYGLLLLWQTTPSTTRTIA